MLALMVVLTATDLEQRRLPHIVLDPLIVVAALFVPFNPAVEPLMALIGAAAAVGLPRGARARRCAAAWRWATSTWWRPSVSCSAGRRSSPRSSPPHSWRPPRASCCWWRGASGMRSYIPFGPFLVAGAVLVLLIDDRLLDGRALSSRGRRFDPDHPGWYPAPDASGSPAAAPSPDDDAPHDAPRLAAARSRDVPPRYPRRLRADVRRVGHGHGRRDAGCVQLLRLGPAGAERARRHRSRPSRPTSTTAPARSCWPGSSARTARR